MRAWFLASWVALGVLLAVLGDNAITWGVTALALVPLPSVLAAVQSRRNGPGDDWFLGFGHWAWAIGLFVLVLAAMPFRLAIPADPEGWRPVHDKVYAFLLAIGAQFTLVTVLHGTMFAWRRPTFGNDGERRVVRYGRGPLRRSARATGLAIAFGGMVTLHVVILSFLSGYLWGEDLGKYGLPLASTLLLSGLGLWWLGSAQGSRRWFHASPRAPVRVVAEEDA